ncbi:ThuA domain-containing protein [Paenibacillus sp. YN15]|uniref:ThuA domain-containing protein n=1 Tax=Paenibacillus sp. YN15 TaxID=1742774 RepID=UPI000DCAF077|nr:ThuA domain-containing protein [Paenibacillus sp. YN15]RAU99565.1 ThuA domain-containing protein [Paenibacillus sp. YN15]
MPIRTLLVGHQESAPYHPLGAVQERLTAIWGDEFHVTAEEGTAGLRKERIGNYELVVSYTDSWKTPAAPEEIAGLLAYVAQGGGLLVLHNGMSLQAAPELAQLAGGYFTGHPPYTGLEFQVTEAGASHPLSAGLPGFTMDEEPYRYDLDPLAKAQVLMTYRHEGQDHPAAWTRPYGLGRVAVLAPGHHLPSFQHEAYSLWVRKAALWAADKL